jgi:plastocyanin
MKFSAASSVAIVAAFAPSLVSAANITVIVGANGLTFAPQQFTAQRGDIVNFEFRGGNHTVTQSSFASPCAWQTNTVTGQDGFNSGFMPFNQTSGQVGVYSFEITDPTTPIWFFCGRPPHCKGGMYGAINPPATGPRTFAAFAASVPTTDEPGLGVKVPFTPPAASSSSSGAVNPTNPTNPANPANTDNGRASSAVATPSNGAATPSSNGAAAPTQSTSAAGSVAARSTFVLGLVGLAAGLVL